MTRRETEVFFLLKKGVNQEESEVHETIEMIINQILSWFEGKWETEHFKVRGERESNKKKNVLSEKMLLESRRIQGTEKGWEMKQIMKH